MRVPCAQPLAEQENVPRHFLPPTGQTGDRKRVDVWAARKSCLPRHFAFDERDIVCSVHGVIQVQSSRVVRRAPGKG